MGTAPYGLTAMKLEAFSGLNTIEDPTNLPPFASPDCPDVEFFPGTVQTRPPLVSQFTVISGNPSINYLKTYITPSEILRMMALDSLGSLWKENPAGTLALAGVIEVPGAYANSVTLFGREYLAIGDGAFGLGIPRQFDDTFFDRVSQEGPGAAPTALDSTATIAVASASQEGSIPVNAAVEYVPHLSQLQCPFFGPFIHVGNNCLITVAGVGALYDGPQNYFGTPLSTPPNIYFPNVNSPTPPTVPVSGTVASSYVTLTTATPHGLSVGNNVIITGIATGGFNGTFAVAAVISPTIFTYFAAATGLGAVGAGGNIQIAGNVSAGVHQCVTMFITRQGYITKPSPPGSWTAAGGKSVTVTNLPIGPPNIIARIVAFTGSAGASFFYVDPADPSFPTSGMVIHDNTTTAATFDFDDQTLLSGNNVDDLFSLVELGECSGVTEYHARLFWTGERNRDTSSPTAQNSESGGSLYGMGFDGGFGASGTGIPNGWTSVPSAAGASSAIAGGFPVVWGDALAITGDGVTAIRGKIFQNAYQDYLGIPIIARNTVYSIRARVCKAGTLTGGSLHINLQSTLGGFTTTGISLSASQVTTSYQEFIVPLTAALATPPTDLILQAYVDGTPTNNGTFLVDCLEIFPTQLPYNSYLVRASFQGRPEAYDGVTGFLSVAENNGQAVRCSFVLRDFLYFVKERSMYVTQDNGDEPATWSINEVSAKVGTESPRGVGIGDEWAVVASRDGLYYFNGGLSAAWSGGESNSKLSTEIQPTWDSINWSVGYLISVTVDTQRKRIYVAVPLGTSTVPNKQLVLDYVEGFGDPMTANGVGRKWSVWNISCNSMALVERFDGTQKLFVGNNAANGKIYQLTPGAASNDDGAAINNYWQSGFFQDQGRLTFGYVSANITGSGTALLTLRRGDQADLRAIRGWRLQANGFNNQDRQIQVERNRMAIVIGTNSVNDFFSLQGMSMYVKPATWAPLRGINA